MSEDVKTTEKAKPAKKAEKDAPAKTGMTPEKAKTLGLDPFPYGG